MIQKRHRSFFWSPTRFWITCLNQNRHTDSGSIIPYYPGFAQLIDSRSAVIGGRRANRWQRTDSSRRHDSLLRTGSGSSRRRATCCVSAARAKKIKKRMDSSGFEPTISSILSIRLTILLHRAMY